LKRPASSYVFTAAELRRMLGRAGFEVMAMNGGFSGEPFQVGSRLMITARRGG
jgi:ATP-dependent phosphoenolpyruvate carboxykinase